MSLVIKIGLGAPCFVNAWTLFLLIGKNEKEVRNEREGGIKRGIRRGKERS